MGYRDEESVKLNSEMVSIKDRSRKIEAEWMQRIDDTKRQNQLDFEKLIEKHTQASTLLVDQKDAIRNSIQDTLDKERMKLDEIHRLDLEHKDRQHSQNLIEQKKLLVTETKHLEEQLNH